VLASLVKKKKEKRRRKGGAGTGLSRFSTRGEGHHSYLVDLIRSIGEKKGGEEERSLLSGGARDVELEHKTRSFSFMGTQGRGKGGKGKGGKEARQTLAVAAISTVYSLLTKRGGGGGGGSRKSTIVLVLFGGKGKGGKEGRRLWKSSPSRAIPATEKRQV